MGLKYVSIKKRGWNYGYSFIKMQEKYTFGEFQVAILCEDIHIYISMSFDVNLLERHCVGTNGYLRLLSPDNIRVPFREVPLPRLI